MQALRGLPHPPPAYDEYQVTPINERWTILPAEAPVEGRPWTARLKTLLWGMVAPVLERQQAFNALLVDHVNRNVATHRATSAAFETTLAFLREELAALVAFQTRLIDYAQQITSYVDTKDREVAGLMRRINEDVAVTAERLERRTVGLAEGIGGVSDVLQKRWESMVARERRYEARVDELRTSFGVVHQAAQTLKREMQHLSATPSGRSAPSAPPAPATGGAGEDRLDSYKYLVFEDLFRGSQDDIRARLLGYLPYFDGATDVLDIGCGRGEFLELLRERGIGARGLDLNHEMVESSRARGLQVDEGDALGYLLGLPDGALGGLFAAQVVEHLEPAYLMRLLDAAFHKLRPGSTMILETINVASWSAFFQSYVRDITHVRPLHPDTLRYLVLASGFQKAEIVYSAPVDEDARLRRATAPRDAAGRHAPDLAEVVAAFNENVDKLNGICFADQDYAVVAERA